MKSRTTLSKSETRKISLILLYLAIVFGIVIGSILFSVSESKFVSSEFVMQYISPFELKGSLLDFFGYSVLSYSLFVISFFILGFCTFGQIMSVILIAFRGIGIGVSVSSMYALMGKKAILAVLLLAVPKLVATSVIFVVASRESLKLANKLYSYAFKALCDDEMKKYIRLYCIKFIVLLFFLLLTAAADGALNYFFVDLCY